MSFLLLLGIFGFLAFAIFLGYLAMKALPRKGARDDHPAGENP